MPFRSHIVAATAVALFAIASRSIPGSSFDAQIGWLEDGCLAVPNGAIAPGASVTFLLFDPERAEGDVPQALLVPGTILARRRRARTVPCPRSR
jgi:hypothetical protein